jgi:hypothetical protein
MLGSVKTRYRPLFPMLDLLLASRPFLPLVVSKRPLVTMWRLQKKSRRNWTRGQVSETLEWQTTAGTEDRIV